ncbi:hypothetical protein [Phocaeicola coprophilus]|uniref:hypothetical protein n=1 Tax=Phocaeicola coprophilus TaxID=387090 RepID=UPI003077D7AC
MQRYGYKATNRNKNKTVMLYFVNMKIAQAFHPLLSSFEVILRNQLHYALHAISPTEIGLSTRSLGSWLLLP